MLFNGDSPKASPIRENASYDFNWNKLITATSSSNASENVALLVAFTYVLATKHKSDICCGMNKWLMSCGVLPFYCQSK